MARPAILAASAALVLLFADSATYGATLPAAGTGPSLVIETALTLVLMGSILLVVLLAPGRLPVIATVVGGTVALCALIGGAHTGASMNPARSFGPLFVEGQLQSLWLYLIAPCAGAVLAVFTCRRVAGGDCCRPG